jgi:hypothetical protein
MNQVRYNYIEKSIQFEENSEAKSPEFSFCFPWGGDLAQKGILCETFFFKVAVIAFFR